jgi:hypothetical protein
MEIVISQGCTAFYTLVDGVDINDMKPEELNIFIDTLLTKLKTQILENTVNLNSVIECFQYDEYNQDEHSCDQCGDSVSRTTWNI